MQNARSILLVDDDAFTRRHLRDTLAGTGYRCFEARNGVEALSFIGSVHPDLVLLDLVMPVMGGLELLGELKAVARAPTVLVMSSLETESLVDEALASGASGFIGKPFRKADVLNEVTRVLEA